MQAWSTNNYKDFGKISISVFFIQFLNPSLCLSSESSFILSLQVLLWASLKMPILTQTLTLTQILNLILELGMGLGLSPRPCPWQDEKVLRREP